MKPSIRTVFILSALISQCLLVDSFACESAASTSTSECNAACLCPTTVAVSSSPRTVQTQIPNSDRATRRNHVPKQPAISAIIRPSTPISLTSNKNIPLISLHPGVGGASPNLVIDRFHLILKQSQTKKGESHLVQQTFQDELQNAADHLNTEQTTSTSSILPLPLSANTIPWKTVFSAIALLSIGGSIASAFFIIGSPQLLSTPTAAAVQSLMVGFLPTYFGFTHVTLHQIYTYFQTKILPAAIPALKKMALMEVWRKLWVWTFRSLRELYTQIFGESYSDSLWRMYVPSFIRMGLKKVGIRAVQTRVESFFWDLWAWGDGGIRWFGYNVVQSSSDGLVPSL